MYECGRSRPDDVGKDKIITLYSYLHAEETKYKQKQQQKTRPISFLSSILLCVSLISGSHSFSYT